MASQWMNDALELVRAYGAAKRNAGWLSGTASAAGQSDKAMDAFWAVEAHLKKYPGSAAEDDTFRRWKVGLFWSSSDPSRQVLVLAEGANIEAYERREDFVCWVKPSSGADTQVWLDQLRALLFKIPVDSLPQGVRREIFSHLESHP